MASPPNSPSRTKEGSALRREYSLDRLEAQEQDFIQHIRTAGLRKPRETALVDELLAMRKERRQIFSALVGHIIRLQSTRLQLAEDVERHIAAQRDLRSAHQEELRKLEETHTSEMRHQMQRLSRKYEDKLRMIGSKVEEVTNAKLRDQQASVDALAKELTSDAVEEVTKKHDEKLLRYKEALRTFAEKEKDMEAVAQKQAGLARAYQREAQTLRQQLEEQKALISDLASKEKTASSLLSLARASLQAEQMESGGLRVEVSRLRDMAQADMRALGEAHGEQLQHVEEMVKAAMSSKDKIIAKLKEELQSQSHARQVAEQILSDLQAGLRV